MAQVPFANSFAWLVAAMPIVVLAGVALLGHMIGEWGRAALLAYAAVLLGFLGGLGTAGATTGLAQLLGGVCVLVAFAALSLGGPIGLSVLAAAYGLLMALVLFKPGTGLPWPLLAAAAAACLVIVVRYRS